MDRNTIIGVILIFLIFIGFGYFNRPSEQQIAAAKRQSDSIEAVRVEQQKKLESEKKIEAIQQSITAGVKSDSLVSVADQARKDKFGVFAEASVGTEKL